MRAANSNVIPPPVISESDSGTTRLGWLLSMALVAGFAVLYLFNPVEHSFYPVCQFYKLTHLYCPGCGSLRALHQLTHGHVGAAFLSNPLLTISIPILAWIGIRKLLRLPTHSATQSVFQSRAPWLVLLVVIVFGILRNLPFAAFAWMSP